MDDQNKNLLIATALCFVVILVWFTLFPPPQPQPVDPNAPAVAESTGTVTPRAESSGAEAPAPAAATTAVEAARISIETPRLSGTISTMGGRIDDLSLLDYKDTLEADSPNVTLLSPVGEEEAYYTLFGWAPGGDLDYNDVPGADTVWEIREGTSLTPATPVTLVWTNAKGMTFERTYEVDENFMFSVTQKVTNNTASSIRVAPYSEIVRHGEPSDLKGFFVIQEGPIRQTGEEMSEFSYKDLRKLPADERWGPATEVEQVQQNGWIGFTDHFWMTMLVPDPSQPFDSVLRYEEASDTYKTIARMATMEVASGDSSEISTRVFAGAKEWETIRHYENDFGVHRFVDTIDWGWFFFITKPIFAVLHWLNGILGNMGWSIIGLTLVIKALLFPLAYKSYVSMARMKELQPEMEKLRERVGDDRQKMQREMMELYKREKVNPAAGCLPILMQIPIFFSLYKVIFVTIELRHAPWIGWIKDLSAPDPSSILNLFGLLPYAPPDPGSIISIISLGVLPILLGISMWLQQKLNPAPTDQTQAMIFAWMPWVFMFMLGGFASGLVVYWIANNTITFIQQYTIMRTHGHKPDVFGNIRKSLKRIKDD